MASTVEVRTPVNKPLTTCPSAPPWRVSRPALPCSQAARSDSTSTGTGSPALDSRRAAFSAAAMVAKIGANSRAEKWSSRSA